MKCEKCGADLNKSANFCRVCGSQVNNNAFENSHSDKSSLLADSSDKSENISNNNDNNTKNENVFSDNSNEIKKMLDEMSIDKKKIDEPTTAIPTELINKYSKGDIEQKKNVSSSSAINSELADAKKLLAKELNNISSESSASKDINKISTSDELAKKEKNDLVKNLCDDVNKKINSENNSKEKNNLNLSDKKIIYNEEISINKEIKNFVNDEIISEKNKEESFEKNKKSEKVCYGRNFFIFFIILICVSAICYLIYVLYGSRNELEKIDKEKLSLQEEILNLKTNSFSNSSQTDGVIFNGYKFSSISNDYSIENDSLILNFNNYTYSIKINKNVSFDTLKANKDIYMKQLLGEGYKILSYGNKHVDENDYYVFAVSNQKSNKYLVAYAKLDESSVIAFVISNKNNDIDYSSLNKSNLIISSISKDVSSKTENLNVFVEKK